LSGRIDAERVDDHHAKRARDGRAAAVRRRGGGSGGGSAGPGRARWSAGRWAHLLGTEAGDVEGRQAGQFRNAGGQGRHRELQGTPRTLGVGLGQGRSVPPVGRFDVVDAAVVIHVVVVRRRQKRRHEHRDEAERDPSPDEAGRNIHDANPA
jgi:hypothetical protein